jgi:hypothetical protein
MSNDNPTFAEIAEENIRQYRKKPVVDECPEDCDCAECLRDRMETMWEDSRDTYD